MTGLRKDGLAFLIVLLFGGCAAVTTDKEWGRITHIAQDQIGQEAIWEQSEAEKGRIRQEVDGLLADGLSKDDAVRIAIINNRTLQSTFEDIGISKSDLIQAGLFTNPSLEALFRFPSGGGRTNIDASLFLTVSDLWQVPFRKKVAAARMEATIMRVGQMLLDTAAEAKRAYDTVYYLSKRQTESAQILKKFQEIDDQTTIRRDFGFLSDQDVYLAQIMVLEAELELTQSEKELAVAKGRLNRILGLRPSLADYVLIEKEAEEVNPVPDFEAAVQHAFEHRLELQMARFKIHQAERTLDLERTRILKHLNLGVSYERETDGTDFFGPAIDIQVPLFDQNQARISRAQYRVRQARKSLEALEGQVREELTQDLERIRLFETQATQLREKVIPLREKILEYAERWVDAMQLNRLYLLEAQRGLLESRREYLLAEMGLRHALTDLENHLGGSLPQGD